MLLSSPLLVVRGGWDAVSRLRAQRPPSRGRTARPDRGHSTQGTRRVAQDAGSLQIGHGTNSLEYERRLAISLKWADTLRHSTLRRTDVEIAYKTMYLPSVGYAIETTTLSRSECDTITRPALQAFLSALGYNRHLSRAVVHGPKLFGGLGLLDLYAEQGVKGTLRLFRYHSLPTSRLG